VNDWNLLSRISYSRKVTCDRVEPQTPIDDTPDVRVVKHSFQTMPPLCAGCSQESDKRMPKRRTGALKLLQCTSPVNAAAKFATLEFSAPGYIGLIAGACTSLKKNYSM
jgi:hypothetical protein